MVFQQSYIKCASRAIKFSNWTKRHHYRDVYKPITRGRGDHWRLRARPRHKRETPGSVISLTLTCQNTQPKAQERRLSTRGQRGWVSLHVLETETGGSAIPRKSRALRSWLACWPQVSCAALGHHMGLTPSRLRTPKPSSRHLALQRLPGTTCSVNLFLQPHLLWRHLRS